MPVFGSGVSHQTAPLEHDSFITNSQGYSRDTKSPNFPVGRISRAKTFRTERVNRFRDKNAPKVRKLFFQHKCDIHTRLPKLSRQSRNFPDSLENSYHVCHRGNGMFAKPIYALFAHLCRKSCLRTFGAFLSRKRFTHSVRKVFVREIPPIGKF